MVQIVGKYQHVSNSPTYEGLVRSSGASEELVKALVASRPVVTITENAGQWTMLVTSDGKDSSSTFKLGEVFEETLPVGLTMKSVASIEGDKVIIKSTFADDKKGTRVYTFTDAGIEVQILDDKSAVLASRTYKRI